MSFNIGGGNTDSKQKCDQEHRPPRPAGRDLSRHFEDNQGQFYSGKEDTHDQRHIRIARNMTGVDSTVANGEFNAIGTSNERWRGRIEAWLEPLSCGAKAPLSTNAPPL